MDVVKLAHQVIWMQNRLDDLEAENAKLRVMRDEFAEHVRGELQHNEKMMVNWLDLLLSDRVKINLTR